MNPKPEQSFAVVSGLQLMLTWSMCNSKRANLFGPRPARTEALWRAKLMLAVSLGLKGLIMMSLPVGAVTTQLLGIASWSPDLVRLLGLVGVAAAVSLVASSVVPVTARVQPLAILVLATVQGIGMTVNDPGHETLPLDVILLSLSIFVLSGLLAKRKISRHRQ